MATYDYFCPLCQAKTVITRPIASSAGKPQCLNCQIDLIRSFTAPGVTFRGTGWGKD
jgi:putative FmdB family regulatory protein